MNFPPMFFIRSMTRTLERSKDSIYELNFLMYRKLIVLTLQGERNNPIYIYVYYSGRQNTIVLNIYKSNVKLVYLKTSQDASDGR